MNKRLKRTIVIVIAAVLLIAAAAAVFLVVKSNTAGYRSISISEIFGRVMTENGGKTYEAYKNMRLADGYALTTDSESYTRMLLDDDKYVKLEQQSHAIFEALGDSKQHRTAIRLEKGVLTTEITKPLSENESYVVNTPNAVLAVRGTLFRVEVRTDVNGDEYTNVYTYGGTVACRRVMPDGSIVDEDVLVPAGYKACIKMDEIITIYVEEQIEQVSDNIDPLELSEIGDDDLVDVYNASRHGHDMFLPIAELWGEILHRNIELDDHRSVYDGGKIPPYETGGTDIPDIVPDNPDNSQNSTESGSDGTGSDDDNSGGAHGGASDRTPDGSSGGAHGGTSGRAPDGSSDTTSTVTDGNASVNDISGIGGGNSDRSDYTPTAPDNSSDSLSGGSGNTDSRAPDDTEGDNVSSGTYPNAGNNDNRGEDNRGDIGDDSGDTLEADGSVTYEATAETSDNTDESDTAEVTDESSGEPTETDDGSPESIETSEDPEDNGDSSDTPDDSGSHRVPNRTPVSNSHTHDAEELRVEPTCVDSGKITKRCRICGEVLSETVLPALGHTERERNTPATCTEDGSRVYFCGSCETILRREVLPAAGHTETKVTVPATCTEDGRVTISCTVCGAVIGETVTPAAGHTEISAETPATCTEAGKITVKCAVCGIVISETAVPATGHTEIFTDTPATCTEDGRVTISCTVCGAVISETVIPAAGHTEISAETPATCTEAGKITVKCAVCGIVISETAVPATGHTEIFTDTPATCTEDGSRVYFCGSCETILRRGVLPAAGHTETTVTVPATCTEDGRVTVSCAVCGDVIGETVTPATGHNEISAETPATCTEDGKITVTCSECDYISETVIPAKGHIFGEYISNNNATCLKDGTMTAVCEVCGERDTMADEGSILLHTPEAVVVPSTCIEKGSETVICKMCETIMTPEKELPLEEHTESAETEGNIETVSCSVCGEILRQTNTDTGVVYPVEVDADSFPDDTFRQYVLDNLDADGDGELSLEESNAVTGIDVSGLDVGSLEGMNAFAELAEVRYTVHVEGGELEISSIGGIDASNVSNVRGGEIGEGAGVISGITEGSDIGFDYDPGTGKPIMFTFVPDESSTFADETPEGVAINVGNFPDEKFREYVSENFDTDGNGYLSQEECEAVTEIDVSGDESADGGITSLVGIENFANLQKLYCDDNSGLTELDVSNNTALTDLGCSYTQITSLDVSNNTALTFLFCSHTQIASLDVSNNTALTFLYCDGTQITSLDVSKNTALTHLGCVSTQITSLDVSSNTALTSLHCGGTQITSLDVSNNTALRDLSCSNTQITSLYVSNNTALTNLDCYGTQITSLDINNNTALTNLSCSNTQIISLDVSNNMALRLLDCGKTQISFVEISNNPNISTFTADGNEHTIHVEDGAFDFKSIDGFDISRIVDGTLTGADMDENGVLSGITEGVNITYTYDCKGTGEIAYQVEFTLVPDENSTFAPETAEGVAINAENFPDEVFRQYVSENFDTDRNGELSQAECEAVTEIRVGSSGITSLKGVENFSKLETLHCYSNSGLTEINVSKNTALKYLSCGSTQITLLDVSKNTALTYLDCSDSQITLLDISKNAVLTDLRCYSTQITSLDVSKNTALTDLRCIYTQITSLNVNNNTELTNLSCGDTQITSLDVSNNTKLSSLSCGDTQITSLDVSNNAALTDLWCYNTQITSLDISTTNITSLSSVYGNKYPIPADTLQFDITSDMNFAGFDPTRVSNVQGADFSPESGIFDNFTADEITYIYDCKGTGESDYMVTFTLVRTGEATVSLTTEDDSTAEAILLLPGANDTPMPSDPVDADSPVAGDKTLPPENIAAMSLLPLGILALAYFRKRKPAFRYKRKASI